MKLLRIVNSSLRFLPSLIGTAFVVGVAYLNGDYRYGAATLLLITAFVLLRRSVWMLGSVGMLLIALPLLQNSGNLQQRVSKLFFYSLGAAAIVASLPTQKSSHEKNI